MGKIKERGRFFVVDRALLMSDRWLSEPFTRGQAWVDLFGLANFADGFIRVRGIRITVKRGQIGWSQIKLADRWKWSRNKVRRYLEELEEDGDIVRETIQQKDKLTSLITVVKYEEYQLGDTTDETAKGQRKDIERTLKGQRKDIERYSIKKKDKNKKNKKKDINSVVATTPTPSQIANEFFTSVDHEEMISYFSSKGLSDEVARNEIQKFILYWTEPNKLGTKERWQIQKTFEIRRRLASWFSRIKQGSQYNQETKGLILK